MRSFPPKVLVTSVLLLASFAGCGGEGESMPAGPDAPTLPPLEGVTFFDNFDRADTTLGLGANSQGLVYDMRGAYVSGFPLPAATDGFIRSGAYTYAGQGVVYAALSLRGTVRRIGAYGRWRKISDGGPNETTIALGIAPNDLYITDIVHFTASRGLWDLTTRTAGGDFVSVANGEFSPMLEVGKDYRFEVTVTDLEVIIAVPGAEVVAVTPAAGGLLGRYAFWEEYPNQPPSGTVFDFDAIWATEDGLPSQAPGQLQP